MKNFLEILFLAGEERVGVILFIPRTISKHKVPLLPSKVCAILHLLNKEVANPPPLKKISQNNIKIKKVFGIFLIFGEWEGVGVILFIPWTVSKHKIQLLPCKVCAILYLSKERVANPQQSFYLFYSEAIDGNFYPRSSREIFRVC